MHKCEELQWFWIGICLQNCALLPIWWNHRVSVRLCKYLLRECPTSSWHAVPMPAGIPWVWLYNYLPLSSQAQNIEGEC